MNPAKESTDQLAQKDDEAESGLTIASCIIVDHDDLALHVEFRGGSDRSVEIVRAVSVEDEDS